MKKQPNILNPKFYFKDTGRLTSNSKKFKNLFKINKFSKKKLSGEFSTFAYKRANTSKRVSSLNIKQYVSCEGKFLKQKARRDPGKTKNQLFKVEKKQLPILKYKRTLPKSPLYLKKKIKKNVKFFEKKKKVHTPNETKKNKDYLDLGEIKTCDLKSAKIKQKSKFEIASSNNKESQLDLDLKLNSNKVKDEKPKENNIYDSKFQEKKKSNSKAIFDTERPVYHNGFYGNKINLYKEKYHRLPCSFVIYCCSDYLN